LTSSKFTTKVSELKVRTFAFVMPSFRDFSKATYLAATVRMQMDVIIVVPY